KGTVEVLKAAYEHKGASVCEILQNCVIKKTIKDHKRILFNGNGYDDAWVKEATEVRGLSNYPTTLVIDLLRRRYPLYAFFPEN
ncbi:MAG: hypothetical protein K6G27_15470, partial [Lachnospiraceae bacterium]|nr:hypothetical protein [Lachnospiraceae bacterium]